MFFADNFYIGVSESLLKLIDVVQSWLKKGVNGYTGCCYYLLLDLVRNTEYGHKMLECNRA